MNVTQPKPQETQSQAHEGYTSKQKNFKYNPDGTPNAPKKPNAVPQDDAVKDVKEAKPAAIVEDASQSIKMSTFDNTFSKVVQSGYQSFKDFETKVSDHRSYPRVSMKAPVMHSGHDLVPVLNKYTNTFRSGYQITMNQMDLPASERLLLIGQRNPTKIIADPRLGYRNANGFNGYDYINRQIGSYAVVASKE